MSHFIVAVCHSLLCGFVHVLFLVVCQSARRPFFWWVVHVIVIAIITIVIVMIIAFWCSFLCVNLKQLELVSISYYVSIESTRIPCSYISNFRSRGSVVGIAGMLRAGRSGVRILVWARGFSLFQNRGPLPGVKGLGREHDHSPPSSAEFKNKWSYVSTPAICPHGVDRDKFTFTFISAVRSYGQYRYQPLLKDKNCVLTSK